MLHALNGCELKLPRFKWRHNSVLGYIVAQLRVQRPDHLIFADLPGHNYRLPFDIEQRYRPDIVLQKGVEITFVELTIPFEDGFEAAHERKETKYLSGIVAPARAAGFSPRLFSVEVGSRGKLAPSWRSFANEFKLKPHVAQKCMSLSLRASHYIWVMRYEVWIEPPLLTW